MISQREVDEALFPRPLGEDAATHAIGFHFGGLFDQDISAYEHISAQADSSESILGQ